MYACNKHSNLWIFSCFAVLNSFPTRMSSLILFFTQINWMGNGEWISSYCTQNKWLFDIRVYRHEWKPKVCIVDSYRMAKINFVSYFWRLLKKIFIPVITNSKLSYFTTILTTWSCWLINRIKTMCLKLCKWNVICSHFWIIISAKIELVDKHFVIARISHALIME